MALDEATAGLLRQLEESGAKPISRMTPEEARGLGGMLRELYGPGPAVAREQQFTVPTPDGDEIVLRALAPESPTAVLVYYHGGGWVMGALDEFDTLGRLLVQATGATVVLVDYRLAPEHRYPTAAEDAWTALGAVQERLADLAGGNDVPLVVAGDSAGGNLAAVVSRRAALAGGPALAAQVLVYPVADADTGTASYTDPANQLMLDRDAMVWFWDHYVPTEAERADPDASPLRATDLDRLALPPTLVLTAEHDVLRDEGESYAEKLRAAGVPVEHRRFAGQMHGFFTMVNVLPGSAEGISWLAERLRALITR